MTDTTALKRYAEEFKALGIATGAGARVSRTVETEQACWSVIRLRLDEDKRVCAQEPLIGCDENEIRGLASEAAMAAEIGDTPESWFDFICSMGLNQILGFTNSGSINGAPHHSTTIYIERLCDLSAVVCKDIVRKVERGELPPNETLQQRLSTYDDPRLLAKSIINQCESKAAGLRAVTMVNDCFNRRLESLGTVAEIIQLYEAGKTDEVIERYNKAQEGGQIAAMEVMATWVRYSPGTHPPASMEHLARIAASRCWFTLREHFSIPVEYLHIQNGHPFASFATFETAVSAQQADTDWSKLRDRIDSVGDDISTAPLDAVSFGPKSAVAVERMAAKKAYKGECKAVGIDVTDLDLAYAAAKHTATTELKRWQANRNAKTQGFDRAIRRVFGQKPHLRNEGFAPRSEANFAAA